MKDGLPIEGKKEVPIGEPLCSSKTCLSGEIEGKERAPEARSEKGKLDHKIETEVKESGIWALDFQVHLEHQRGD